MEPEFIKTIVNQAPGLAVAAFIVWQFLKHMKELYQIFIQQMNERDNLFITQMNKVVEELAQLKTMMVQHDANSSSAWGTRKDTLDRIDKKLDNIQRRKLKSTKTDGQ